MTFWPTISDFCRAVQAPQVAFCDHELRDCAIEKSANGLPRVMCGSFAAVFKGHLPSGRNVAIRVYTGQYKRQEEHYRIISAYLAKHNLPWLVPCEYVANGIRLLDRPERYPIVVSDWQSGTTLYSWLEAKCRRGDRRAIAGLAEIWTAALLALYDARVAHGDLQCGNVLVNEHGEMTLIDYDSMSVPGLEGRTNLEIGVAPYQHPGRDANTRLSRDLDNFSALFILVALKALGCDPGLWRKHIERPGYDKLLFRDSDFQRPEDSAVYRDLMQLPDSATRSLTQTLFELWRGELSAVPPLEEAIRRVETPGRTPPAELLPPTHAFLSYRREGGSETARLVKLELHRRGIQVFLDVDDLRSHHFDERLLREIERHPNFIVILSPGCLDRCAREGDWLRREIAHAIRLDRNLVPILKDGFRFPPAESLPAEIRDLPRYNCVEYSHAYFSSTVDRLVSFLENG